MFWIPAYTTTRSNAPNLIAVIPIKTMPISPKCTCDAFSVVIQQLQLTCSFKVGMPIHVSQALGKGRESSSKHAPSPTASESSTPHASPSNVASLLFCLVSLGQEEKKERRVPLIDNRRQPLLGRGEHDTPFHRAISIVSLQMRCPVLSWLA